MRSTLAKANRSREPVSAQTKTADTEDEETRAVAAELESLRRARTASLSYKKQSRRESWSNDSDDSGLPAAAKFLSSWAHQDPNSRKRPYESYLGSDPQSKRRGVPGEPSVADAAIMAQIGQLRPSALPPSMQPPLPHRAVAAAPRAAAAASLATTDHDKAFLVEQATELVCRALLDGPWPSSTDFSVVVAALHQFASDIIVPALYAVDPQPTVTNDTPIILGTLLMLREALILNSDSIFGTFEEDEEDFRSRRSNQRNSQSDYFTACTLSTAVLLAALDSLDGESSSTFTPKFLRLVDAYESGQGDFAQLAAAVDDEGEPEPSAVSWPGDTPMDADAQEAWRASHRLHMDSHPSVLAQRHGPDVRPIQHNAVHISVIGEQHVTEGSTGT